LIADTATSGIGDEEVFRIASEQKALLITRDYHFTNPLRFPPQKTRGIIFIRHGNLASDEEIGLVKKFLALHVHEEFDGKLVTLYKDGVKIR